MEETNLSTVISHCGTTVAMDKTTLKSILLLLAETLTCRSRFVEIADRMEEHFVLVPLIVLIMSQVFVIAPASILHTIPRMPYFTLRPQFLLALLFNLLLGYHSIFLVSENLNRDSNVG